MTQVSEEPVTLATVEIGGQCPQCRSEKIGYFPPADGKPFRGGPGVLGGMKCKNCGLAYNVKLSPRLMQLIITFLNEGGVKVPTASFVGMIWQCHPPIDAEKK